MTKIYVVRHAQSIFNASDKAEEFKSDGELGSPLSDTGRMQTKDLAAKLKDINFDAIFSSDMTRTMQTAGIIAIEKKLAVNATNAIRERSIHHYLHKQGNLSRESMEKLYKEMQEMLKDLNDKSKMQYKHTPDMESAEEGAVRLLAFIREVAVAYSGKTILIVCHGNIMRSLLTHLGYAKYDELPSGAVQNTGYFVLESDGTDFFIKEVSGINKQQSKIRTF